MAKKAKKVKKIKTMNKSEFAARAGVSKQAIGKAFNAKLFRAVIGKGRDAVIDIEHPLAVDYVTQKRVDKKSGKLESYQAGAVKDVDDKKKGPGSDEYSKITLGTGEILDLEGMTIKEIVTQYGGIVEFKNMVDALKSLADYKNKELLTRERRKDLIEKNPTGMILFSLIDIAFNRLVTDIPDGMVQQIIARVRSNKKNVERDVLDLIKKPISKVLKEAKKEVKKKIKEVSID